MAEVRTHALLVQGGNDFNYGPGVDVRVGVCGAQLGCVYGLARSSYLIVSGFVVSGPPVVPLQTRGWAQSLGAGWRAELGNPGALRFSVGLSAAVASDLACRAHSSLCGPLGALFGPEVGVSLPVSDTLRLRASGEVLLHSRLFAPGAPMLVPTLGVGVQWGG